MRLIAEITDPELLTELIHEKGTSFWKNVEDQKGIYEVVYFSGNRVIHFQGPLSQEQLNTIKHTATHCSKIKFDLDMEQVRVVE